MRQHHLSSPERVEEDKIPSAQISFTRRTHYLIVYPGATHAFNADAPPRVYLGHHLRYDAAAAADAETRVRGFLHDTLQAPAKIEAAPTTSSEGNTP